MCAPGTKASLNERAAQPRILFLERPFDRQILNAPSLCTWLRHKFKAEAQLISDTLAEQHGVCAAVEIIRGHDIFVTIDGSQALLLSFARPGSVVILVSPKNSFNGLTKLLLSTAGMRVLEFLVHRPTELVADTESSEYMQRIRGRQAQIPGPGMLEMFHHPLQCVRWRECFEFWIRSHVWLNFDEFWAFVDYARNASSSTTFNVDDIELDMQFRQWDVQLKVGEDERWTRPPCQQLPAEPVDAAPEEYPFIVDYGRLGRRVAWEVRTLPRNYLRHGCVPLANLSVRVPFVGQPGDLLRPGCRTM
jgi:hypothetical protein